MLQIQMGQQLHNNNCKLVVGLGNPGIFYLKTRHNIGFEILDKLANVSNFKFQSGFNGFYFKKGKSIYLKPQTFMNLSGDPVMFAVNFYKINPKNVLVIHDEIDLPFGSIRIKKGGGHAGHNGVRDIGRAIGFEFCRIRIGISRPSEKISIEDYVLSKFSNQEELLLSEIFQKSIEFIDQFNNE